MAVEARRFVGFGAQVAEEDAGQKYRDDRQYHRAVVAGLDVKSAKLPVQKLLIAPGHVDLLDVSVLAFTCKTAGRFRGSNGMSEKSEAVLRCQGRADPAQTQVQEFSAVARNGCNSAGTLSRAAIAAASFLSPPRLATSLA
jgi:hypothetical protein